MPWQALVIGLAIGWLAELAVDYFFWRKRRVCSGAEQELQETVDILNEEVNRLKKKYGDQPDGPADERAEEEEKEEEPEELEPDDLKRIWGIGPKIETLLNLKGITTFERLAAADHMALEQILEEAGARFKMSQYNVVESWNDQARMAADGRWQELDAYQAKLAGMRRLRNR
jgi:predicted flap endonuclease-1-like 5' DNA nuclease